MPFRRLVAFVFLLAAAVCGVMAVNEFRGGEKIAALVLGGWALGGLVLAAVLDSKASPREAQESGYISERARVPFLVTVLLVFGGMLFFIGGRGIAHGVMPALGDAADVPFAASPVRFVLLAGFWCGCGVALAWGAWWVVRYERTKAAQGAAVDDTGGR